MTSPTIYSLSDQAGKRAFEKYNVNGPRYTSYPTALEFNDDVSFNDVEFAITNNTDDGLSLYIHIPFCHSLCYYCGCNKVVTRHQSKADEYLNVLSLEIIAYAKQFEQHCVREIHLGGGTPSFLSKEQMFRLTNTLKSYFNVSPNIEMSIEIDPRKIDIDYIDHLAMLGFDRLSIGVQDTNKEVQQAINREQDTSFIAKLVERARHLKFRSINLDVIYGLPFQTLGLFKHTLEQISLLNPDRVSLFSYAHLPDRFAAQRKIKDEWLPSPQDKLTLMFTAINYFTKHGYIAIGMDHFAKPDDALCLAQKEGRLHRNFQGYTANNYGNLLGLGVSAISKIGPVYVQNHKTIRQYYKHVNQTGHAVEKGLILSRDDELRADLIKHLMCNFSIDIKMYEEKWSIDFFDYFSSELQDLKTFVDDDLMVIRPHRIEVLTHGQLLIRTICMAFDKYLKKQINQQRFSRVI